MKKSINKILTSTYYGARPCEYIDLRNVRTEYKVLKYIYFRVLKLYENFVLLEKVIRQGDEYIKTGIRECFVYHEMRCYLYTYNDIEEAWTSQKIICIPVKIKKYE